MLKRGALLGVALMIAAFGARSASPSPPAQEPGLQLPVWLEGTIGASDEVRMFVDTAGDPAGDGLRGMLVVDGADWAHCVDRLLDSGDRIQARARPR